MPAAQMFSPKHLGLTAGAMALAICAPFASPAAAQAPSEPIVATNIAFFEDVQLGDLTLSPVNIFQDTRCPDPEFCFKNNRFAISVIMFTQDGLQEVVLRLFEPKPVPGGVLTLTNTGTPPSQNGAIELDKYQLELTFRPTAQVTAPRAQSLETQAKADRR